jgi:hypothetical protein
VLGQCTSLAHLNLRANQIGDAGAERVAGVLAQCRAQAHLDFSDNVIDDAGQRVLQDCWGNAQRWLTSISEIIRSDDSDQTGQRVLQECWCSVHRWLTSISARIRSDWGFGPD